MKATINFNGTEKTFKTIKELKKFLNKALYYASELILFNYKANLDPLNYTETNDLAFLISECNSYDEVLNIVQDFN